MWLFSQHSADLFVSTHRSASAMDIQTESVDETVAAKTTTPAENVGFFEALALDLL
jgi:hypothetical protein